MDLKKKWEVAYKQEKRINNSGYPEFFYEFWIRTQDDHKLVLQVHQEPKHPFVTNASEEVALLEHLVRLHNNSLEPPVAVTKKGVAAEASPVVEEAVPPKKKHNNGFKKGVPGPWAGIPLLKHPDGSRMKKAEIDAILVHYPEMRGMATLAAQAYLKAKEGEQDLAAIKNSGMTHSVQETQEATQPDRPVFEEQQEPLQSQESRVEEDLQTQTSLQGGLYQ